jgi:predicted MFS family arabinose efflux permease
MIGGFFSFNNFLQKVLINKFEFNKIIAGQLVSIPFWISFSSPIFGIIIDIIGMRIIGVIFSGFLGISTIFILYFGNNSIYLVIFALVIFGLYLTTATTYLYPTIPLLCDNNKLTVAVGINSCFRNIGLSILSFIGGNVIDSKGIDGYLAMYIAI